MLGNHVVYYLPDSYRNKHALIRPIRPSYYHYPYHSQHGHFDNLGPIASTGWYMLSTHMGADNFAKKKKRLSELWCEKCLVSYIIPLTHTAKPSILCSATHGVGCVRGLCEFCRFMTKDCSSGEAIDHVRIIFKQLKITHG